MSKSLQHILSVLVLSISLISCVNEIENIDTPDFNDEIFQYSSKDGLLAHEYVGNLSIKEIKSHGDFGLGTFNMVDGEMVIFNKNVYQVLTDGTVDNIESEKLSPFVVTKFFIPDTSFALPQNISIDSAKTIIQSIAQIRNKPFAVKISGKYSSIKSRSVDKVANLSVSLEEIIANQTVFNFTDAEANVIGFWYPEYFDGVNFPGFHLHILLNNLSGGGHLLDATLENAKVEIDFASGVNIELLENE